MSRRRYSGKAARLIRFGLPGAVVLLVLAAAIAVTAGSRPAAAARSGFGEGGWVTSWSASPPVARPGTLGGAGFDDQTVRDIIFTSVGGDLVRLELTNVFGTSPLRVGRVTMAVAGLHPNAAGYQAMANAINLRMLMPSPLRSPLSGR